MNNNREASFRIVCVCRLQSQAPALYETFNQSRYCLRKNDALELHIELRAHAVPVWKIKGKISVWISGRYSSTK
jgi:endonuclease I